MLDHSRTTADHVRHLRLLQRATLFCTMLKSWLVAAARSEADAEGSFLCIVSEDVLMRSAP
jgi:hypothetical protein